MWDFVHIEFDRSLRTDLLAQLIANYSSQGRCSYVESVRVNHNRADLARALRLPLPVKKSAAASVVEVDSLGSAEEIGFVEDLVSNWILLHEDTWMMPNEVLNWTKVIKEGNFEKVDWASLIWFMVEKELVQSPNLVNCYYASHLQHLIRSQREELLMEAPKAEVEVEDVKDDDDEDELSMLKEPPKVVLEAVEEVKDDDNEFTPPKEAPKVVVEEVEEVKGNDNVEEDLLGSAGDVKMAEVEEFQVQGSEEEARVCELEEHKIELSLGHDNAERVEEKVEGVEEKAEKVEEKMEVEVENVKERVGDEDVMDYEQCREESKEQDEDVVDFEQCREESKEQEEGAQWLLDGKSNLGDLGEPFLRPCNVGEVRGLVSEEEEKKREEEEEVEEEGQEEEEEEDEEEEEEEEDEEGEREVGGFNLLSKCNPLDSLAPGGSLIPDMHMPFSSGLEIRDHLAGDFLSSRDDGRLLSAGTSLFGNANKRGIDHENDNIHNSFNGGNKRLRSDGSWDGKATDFDMCMEQMQHWMGKTRTMYAAKEQACAEATVNQQFLLNELQQRETMIDHLRTVKFEEQQKRQVEVYRLERELFLMGNLLEGYRKALKETNRAFSEYRARCPQPEEPLYKDVPGSGGLVLSTMELEKRRLKQEEEDRMNRLLIERKVKDFEGGWVCKFESHSEAVNLLGNRLLDVENGVKLVKESFAKRRVSETSEGAPNEPCTSQ